jgi:putative ABC transport system substrate-binding protein
LEEGLRQFGHLVERNIAIEWWGIGGRSEQFLEFAAELVRLKVDIIVATNKPAVAAAQEATTTERGRDPPVSLVR